MNIFSLLNNDTSELSEEERELVESFNEAIREKLIEALAECEINELIKDVKIAMDVEIPAYKPMEFYGPIELLKMIKK